MKNYLLANPGTPCHKKPDVKPRPPRMTIAIGIISDTGITFASDSQMTQGFDHKSLKSEKIFRVETPKMQTHSEMLIAIAGDVDISKMVVSKMINLCKIFPFDGPSSPVEVLRLSVRDVKKEILEAQGAPDSTLEEKQNFFNQRPTEFLLGYYTYEYKYLNPHPHLYHMKFTWGIEEEINNGGRAIGSGALLAEFLLNIFHLDNIGYTPMAMTAIYIIEQVKRADLYCSGETQVWGIRRPYYRSELHFAFKQKPAIVDLTVSELLKIEPELRRGFVDLTTNTLRTLVQSQAFRDLSLPTERPPPSAQSPAVAPATLPAPAPGHPSTPPTDLTPPLPDSYPSPQG